MKLTDEIKGGGSLYRRQLKMYLTMEFYKLDFNNKILGIPKILLQRSNALRNKLVEYGENELLQTKFSFSLSPKSLVPMHT